MNFTINNEDLEIDLANLTKISSYTSISEFILNYYKYLFFKIPSEFNCVLQNKDNKKKAYNYSPDDNNSNITIQNKIADVNIITNY